MEEGEGYDSVGEGRIGKEIGVGERGRGERARYRGER